MEDQIQKIVQELFELDPELRTEEVLVRKLVLEMLESRPAVMPDAALKATVRARLLATLATSKTEAKTGFVLPWWLIYSAPVGVAALLFMLTTPGNGPIILAPYSSVPVEEMAPMSEPAVSAKGSPEMDSAAGMRSMTMPTDMGGDMMVESPEVQVYEASTLIVGSQVPGMTVLIEGGLLTNNAFVTVRELATGTIIGVSEMKLSGEMAGFLLPLISPTEAGMVYEAAIYFDDGDGLFAESADSLVFSSSFVADL